MDLPIKNLTIDGRRFIEQRLNGIYHDGKPTLALNLDSKPMDIPVVLISSKFQLMRQAILYYFRLFLLASDSRETWHA